MGQANLTGDVPLFSRFVNCMVHNSPPKCYFATDKTAALTHFVW